MATVNGIQLEDLQQTIQEVQKNPEIARFKFKASNKWIDGTHNQATVKDFFGAGTEDQNRQKPMVFEEDESPVLLGKNEEANPVALWDMSEIK